MNTDVWNRIAEEYAAAKQCLWCPKNNCAWRRDDDQGMFHLWNAYYAAINETEKDNLLYARILTMMSRAQFNVSQYDRFHKYIAPAYEAYNKAIEAGNRISDKEKEFIKRDYDSLKYELEKTENTKEACEASYAVIPDLAQYPDFQFHDSKPIYFSHTSESAELRLDYDGEVRTFTFNGLIDIHVEGDPTVNWINDFYCYRMLFNPKAIMFDIGYYKILCEEIHVS